MCLDSVIQKVGGATVPGKSKPYAPYINGNSDGKVNLNVNWADNANSNYAEVAVRDCSDEGGWKNAHPHPM